jgi:hypothetical protein
VNHYPVVTQKPSEVASMQIDQKKMKNSNVWVDVVKTMYLEKENSRERNTDSTTYSKKTVHQMEHGHFGL